MARAATAGRVAGGEAPSGVAAGCLPPEGLSPGEARKGCEGHGGGCLGLGGTRRGRIARAGCPCPRGHWDAPGSGGLVGRAAWGRAGGCGLAPVERRVGGIRSWWQDGLPCWGWWVFWRKATGNVVAGVSGGFDGDSRPSGSSAGGAWAMSYGVQDEMFVCRGKAYWGCWGCQPGAVSFGGLMGRVRFGSAGAACDAWSSDGVGACGASAWAGAGAG